MQNEINTLLNKIIKLLKIVSDENSNGLDGTVYKALFFFYCYRYLKEDIYYEDAVNLLYKSFDALNNDHSNPYFLNGISGIAWMVEHLKENNFIEIDSDELFSNVIDSYLHQNMLNCMNSNNFGLHNGALGIGLYFVKRYSNSNFQNLKYKNYIVELIVFLERYRINSLERNESLMPNEIYKNEDIDYWSLITKFLIILIPIDRFNPIIFPILEDYSNRIFKNVEKLNSKPDTLFGLWQAGKMLNNTNIVESIEVIFLKNDYQSYSIKENLKIWLIYDYLNRKGSNINYKDAKMNFIKKVFTQKNLNNTLLKSSVFEKCYLGFVLMNLEKNIIKEPEELFLIDIDI